MRERETLFISSRADRSGRTAVICEEADSVWLYLSAPDREGPEKDCWLLNTPEAPSRPVPNEYRQQGSPPPVPADRVLSGGQRTPPPEEHWSIVWSADGTAVGVLLDGEPIGFIDAVRRRGSARHIKPDASPWAEVWDAEAWTRLFGG